MSQGAEHDTEMAWLWEGKDIADDEGSWMQADAGDLEVATPQKNLAS